MKPWETSARFLNLGRGALVDEAALVDTLNTGSIAFTEAEDRYPEHWGEEPGLVRTPECLPG
ncbi:MAG: NAD(P)-dependent oxidoreductase [Gammaproteobacteria bacterium]|nr:NAD(P)-dependent oxidoreductase [Gammaproteobacteria bacterium]